MTNPGTLFIARGLPGSGRTTAIERMRTAIPGLVFVDADPPGVGDDFGDPANHHRALLRAAEDIKSLVDHSVEHIAVETSAPRAKDVAVLVDAARKAGYSIEPVEPAGQEPNDVIYCFEKSTHQPSPEFLNDLVVNWEALEFRPEPELERDGFNRKAAWKLFTAAMAAETPEAATRAMDDVYRRFPAEAAALQLEVGPSWGRLPVTKEPAFPLADISPYWAEIKGAALSVATDVAHRLRALPTPKLPTQEISPA